MPNTFTDDKTVTGILLAGDTSKFLSTFGSSISDPFRVDETKSEFDFIHQDNHKK